MTKSRQPSVEEITDRAYGLYLERGGDDGGDVEDWVKAEKELTPQPVAESSKPRAHQLVRSSLN
jgi:hypothetical protein